MQVGLKRVIHIDIVGVDKRPALHRSHALRQQMVHQGADFRPTQMQKMSGDIENKVTDAEGTGQPAQALLPLQQGHRTPPFQMVGR